MKINRFTLIMTDHCNFDCSYCNQRKENIYLNRDHIEKALDFFYPFFPEWPIITFYGGEPLLAYEEIKYTVNLLKEKDKEGNKKPRFLISTNGSLLTDEKLSFLSRNKFTVLLSFDGKVQERGREPGSFPPTLEMMKRLNELPGIYLEINSVFTPKTVPGLSQSVRFLVEQGAGNIFIDFSLLEQWTEADHSLLEEQLEQLGQYLAVYHREHNKIPVFNFRPPAKNKKKKARSFACGAGSNRMSLAPDGKVWGCYTFHDYLKHREQCDEYQRYCFGGLENFIKNHKTLYPKILTNYKGLRLEDFETPKGACSLCGDLMKCAPCPVYVAYKSNAIGKVPVDFCRLSSIQREAKTIFLDNTLEPY